MDRNGWAVSVTRSLGAGAAVVVSAAVGLVTNLVTNKWSLALALALGMLVVLAVVLQVVLSRAGHRDAAGAPQLTQRASTRRGGTVIQAGRDVRLSEPDMGREQSSK